MNGTSKLNGVHTPTNLFVIPGQCNFSGRKYSINDIASCICDLPGKILSILIRNEILKLIPLNGEYSLMVQV